MSKKLEDLKKRGFFQELSNEEFFKEKEMTFYLGIDPTATGLHIGHLVPIKLALELIDLGYKCIILLGGFTGQIGDPTGKTEARKSLEEKETMENSKGILKDLKKIFKGKKVIFVNNNNWLKNMKLPEFLTYSSKASFSKISSLKTIEDRVNNSLPINMKEISYCILQGIDHLKLLEKYNCRLQIGGGDQWGNISFSVHLVEKFTKENIYGICTPLLLDKSGKKISKTSSNFAFIHPDNIWNFSYNLQDEVTEYIYKLFCDLKVPGNLKTAREEIAKSIILLYYKDINIFNKTKEKMKNLFNSDLDNLDFIEVKTAPLYVIINDLLKLNINLNKAQIKNAIASGGVYIDNKSVKNEDIIEKGKHILKIGKSNIIPLLVI